VASVGRYEGAKAEKAVPSQTSLPIDLAAWPDDEIDRRFRSLA
jgi:hypothetical protein